MFFIVCFIGLFECFHSFFSLVHSCIRMSACDIGCTYVLHMLVVDTRMRSRDLFIFHMPSRDVTCECVSLFQSVFSVLDLTPFGSSCDFAFLVGATRSLQLATCDDCSFSFACLGFSRKFPYTVAKSGELIYYCSIRPLMVQRLVGILVLVNLAKCVRDIDRFSFPTNMLDRDLGTGVGSCNVCLVVVSFVCWFGLWWM